MKSLTMLATRLGDVPQPPPRNRNGTSMTSKKITKSARSWAMSAPSTPLSARPNHRKNRCGRSHSRSAAHAMLAKNSSAASAMRKRFRPSTPSL